ncbi:ABC transporter ATP-binding protein [uncultured Methanospirillum sp.]|uniref:ABC transporter ATP-binding protein n=1 Tax=uncultured Methanospirillum sp. TaxID=262503 RepID=UPI0029C861E7|nr:ABC transporter ATP-binding protein [uncultured Methanospirillum sp.]
MICKFQSDISSSYSGKEPVHDPHSILLDVNGVSFQYQATDILENICVNVHPGEILAIMGPNGVGKSTLLRCMNRILQPRSGIVTLEDKDLCDMNVNDIAKKIGYVPQRNETSRMTVYDSILLGRKPHIRWTVSEDDYVRVETIIRLFDLERLQLRYVDEISGGEYQRVCLCRAIVQEPSLLLLDEPTSALDLCRQIEILRVIRSIVDMRHLSTVMTMHDLNLALRFADRFVLMKNGRIAHSCDRTSICCEIIEDVYGIRVDILSHNGLPVVIPIES